MFSIQDLHIEKEILPFFDYTNNDYAREVILTILRTPLPQPDILERQDILKGFIKNQEIIRQHNYSRAEFLEIYHFLLHLQDLSVAPKKVYSTLFESTKENAQIISKYVQLILFLHKIDHLIIAKISPGVFPERYQGNLEKLKRYLVSLDLAYYQNLILHKKFRQKHAVIFSKLLSYKKSTGETASFWNNYFHFEAYASISNGINKQNFCFPVFCEQDIRFQQIYHPLIKNPVKASFTISKNVVLLTGPNMSGKSTLLKAIGLSIFLGHIGLAVPASRAAFPYFKNVSISINLKDDIRNGYSHFMTEISNLKNVAQRAATGETSFAIFDELFRGTNAEDALAITAATVKGFVQLEGSCFFISTHLHELKDINTVKTQNTENYYLDCIVENEVPTFSYQLKKGWSDLKIGQLLFEKEGLNRLFSSIKNKET